MRRPRLVVLLALALIASGTTSAVASTSTWKPSSSDRFQIVLSNTPTVAQRHGSFSAMEIDGFESTASVVRTLHSLHKRAVCYIDAGTWEQWRPDAKKFPTSVLGKSDVGWIGERWLDIRQQNVLLPLMRARFAMCVKKGFDAVDADNVNGVDNATGFALTYAQQLSYDRALAAIAHADHLAIALKSYPGGAADLESSFDFVVEEQCVQYHECSAFKPFVLDHKPVFDIEYTTSLKFCGSLPLGIFGIAKHLSLDAWVRRCP